MQSAKDSLFMHFRDRLQQINPARTVELHGNTRPALVVEENEPAAADPLPGVFYLRWRDARAVARQHPGLRPLLALALEIHYRTRGSAASQGVDRGRALAELDAELLALCDAGRAPKLDHTQSPPATLNSHVLWAPPRLGAVEALGGELRRTATLLVLFYPEVSA